MAEQVKVEIIAVGNELLLGDVLDTNTNWLCKKITGVGGLVTRAAMIRDELDAIVAEITAALERRPQLIITTGGLGPTADDITFQAVAEATARSLHLDPEARSMVQAKYEDLAEEGYVEDATLTAAREKMAFLPQGAKPVANPVGAAPAAILEVAETTLISLPGVPEELKSIYEETLQPTLKAIFGHSYFQEKRVIAHCGDESMLAPILRAVVEAYPNVYIKSRPRRFGPGVKILITLSSAGEDRDEVKRRIHHSSRHLTAALTKAGIGVEVDHNT